MLYLFAYYKASSDAPEKSAAGRSSNGLPENCVPVTVTRIVNGSPDASVVMPNMHGVKLGRQLRQNMLGDKLGRQLRKRAR